MIDGFGDWLASSLMGYEVTTVVQYFLDTSPSIGLLHRNPIGYVNYECKAGIEVLSSFSLTMSLC